MTTTTPNTPPTLTPARKRLIRQARRLPLRAGAAWLAGLPSFADVPPAHIREWMCYWHDDRSPSQRRQPRKQAATALEGITQANETMPASDPPTGEWYSARAIAKGLDIGVERVYAWALWGWLPRGPLYTAEDIRAFFRFHPLEVAHIYLTVEQWLWLVSVLAGSREGAA